jgi:hypothetical protein
VVYELQKVLDNVGQQLAAICSLEDLKVRTQKTNRTTTNEERKRYGWSDDPAERSREMRRRQAMRKLHPRDARSPEHAAWVEKMRAAQRKRRSQLGTRGRKQLLRQAARRPHCSGGRGACQWSSGMTSRLSSLQYPLLLHFVRSVFYMPIGEAQKFDQRPFRSLLVRKWIGYSPGRGFRATPKGRNAWEEFQHRSITRTHPERPLTAYFDYWAYGLDPLALKKKLARLAVMPKAKTV